MACRGVMKWRRELLHIYESKCFSRLRPAGYAVPSLARRFYEAHLRCMKQSFGLWSAPSVHEAILRIMKHACRRMKQSLFRLHVFLPWNQGKKNGVEVTVSAPQTHKRTFKSLLCKCNYLRNCSFYDLWPQKQVQLITSAPDIEITAG